MMVVEGWAFGVAPGYKSAKDKQLQFASRFCRVGDTQRPWISGEVQIRHEHSLLRADLAFGLGLRRPLLFA